MSAGVESSLRRGNTAKKEEETTAYQPYSFKMQRGPEAKARQIIVERQLSGEEALPSSVWPELREVDGILEDAKADPSVRGALTGILDNANGGDHKIDLLGMAEAAVNEREKLSALLVLARRWQQLGDEKRSQMDPEERRRVAMVGAALELKIICQQITNPPANTDIKVSREKAVALLKGYMPLVNSHDLPDSVKKDFFAATEAAGIRVTKKSSQEAANQAGENATRRKQVMSDEEAGKYLREQVKDRVTHDKDEDLAKDVDRSQRTVKELGDQKSFFDFIAGTNGPNQAYDKIDALPDEDVNKKVWKEALLGMRHETEWKQKVEDMGWEIRRQIEVAKKKLSVEEERVSKQAAFEAHMEEKVQKSVEQHKSVAEQEQELRQKLEISGEAIEGGAWENPGRLRAVQDILAKVNPKVRQQVEGYIDNYYFRDIEEHDALQFGNQFQRLWVQGKYLIRELPWFKHRFAKRRAIRSRFASVIAQEDSETAARLRHLSLIEQTEQGYGRP